MAGTDDGDGGNPGGVLGNLPRSRPGQRSEKRGDPGPSAGRPSPTAAPPGDARGEREDGGRPNEPSSSGEAPEPGLALGGAVRVAGRAVRLGLGAAGGVLKRLPRP